MLKASETSVSIDSSNNAILTGSSHYEKGSWDDKAGYESGHSVSLSSDGKIVAIGARPSDNDGVNSGHVRIYSFKKGISKQRYPTSLMGSIALIRQTLLDANWYAQQEKKELNLSLSSFNETKHLPNIFSITDFWLTSSG